MIEPPTQSLRASRTEWWVIFIGSHFVGLSIERTLLELARRAIAQLEPWQSIMLISVIMATIFGFVLLSQYRVSLRRARDLDVGLAPWWPYVVAATALKGALAYGEVPYVDHLWFWTVYLAALTWMAVVLGWKEGPRASNRWGAPPKPFFTSRMPKVSNYRPPRS